MIGGQESGASSPTEESLSGRVSRIPLAINIEEWTMAKENDLARGWDC